MTEKIKKKKRLLIFHPALAPYRVDMFNSLHKLYDASFYFLNENVQSQKFSQQKLINSTSININYLNKGFTLFGRFFRFGIKDIIKKEKPQLILSTEYSTITLSIYFLSKIFNSSAKIYTLTEDNISMMENASLVQILMRKFLLKRLDGVIVTHRAIQDYYNEKFNAKTNFVIFPTIRTEALYKEQLEGSISYSNKNIKDYNLNDKHVLLYVGRLVEVKNLKKLVLAFKEVNNKISNSILVFVGEGNQKEILMELTDSNEISDSVIFTGRLEGPELLSWYNTSNIFILPSTYEPFGAVINEALLAGCYSLVSNTSGGACLVTENENGKIFDPYNVSDIAKAIEYSFNCQKTVANSDSIKKSKMLIDYSATVNELFRKLQ